MGFFNKYPYTDFHELNADWLLKEMQELDTRLDEALTTISEQVYTRVMTDIRPELTSLRNSMNGLTNDFNELRGEFETLDSAFDSFTAYVEGRLDILKNYVDSQTVLSREYTNTAIEQNNTYIIDQLSTFLSQLKVINFFTGELIPVQDMFDFLAGLHATDALDYNTMVTRAKTYTELAAFNKTYTDLVMTGNTWYI